MTASWASGGGGCGDKSGCDRNFDGTLGARSRWGGLSGTGGSGGGSSGTGDGGFLGGGGPGEPTARVLSVLHFGGKKPISSSRPGDIELEPASCAKRAAKEEMLKGFFHVFATKEMV
nr:glycine-rich protein DOT1-like [Aegilops tauschii subsp. strangulata]